MKVNGWQILVVSGLMSLSTAEANAGEMHHQDLEELKQGTTWRGWDKYQAIMWSTGRPKDRALWFKRLLEMGCTGEQCYRGNDPAPFVQHGLNFYAENLVPQLAYLHSRGKLYKEDFQGYTKTRDKKFLVRKPCLHDPDFWDEIEDYLKKIAQPYVPHKPLLYNLQDELSIGSFASPMDYCFGPHTLGAFREWLKEQYSSLDALNQEWETQFASWGDVVPMTTYEIKDREREALATGESENYAPWADHRAFMDISFAQALHRLRGFIRELDPNTPVGIEGTQMPSAWGGYDLWRMSQVIDWVEPYDIANSREIFRSFLPPTAPVVGTVFGSDFPRIRRKLWWLLLHGDRGCIIWDDDKSRCIEKAEDDMPITERGKGLAEIFAELKSVAPTLFKLQRVDDRIAIHYSQASIRAHWMFDSREDKDTWPRRFSSYEAKHSRLAHARDSFVRVIKDLGLQSNFVSYEQIENGELLTGGYREGEAPAEPYKILLLPQCVAMSQKECQQIEAFVRAGGTVIADNMTATMDEHCKRLPQGQLDDLFGIKRSEVGYRPKAEAGSLPSRISEAVPLQVYEPDITTTTGEALYFSEDIPAVIERSPRTRGVGDGRTIYLNLDMRDYREHRGTPSEGENYRELFRRLLKESGIDAPLRVLDATSGEPVPCVEIWRYRGEDADYFALMPDPGVRGEGVQVVLPRQAQVTDVRTEEDLGVSNRVKVELEPWCPVILKLE